MAGRRAHAIIASGGAIRPLALAGHAEHGEVNSYLHIWPYESLNHRAEIREKARAAGAWPPPGGGDMLLTQANKIMLPASFSPLQ